MLLRRMESISLLLTATQQAPSKPSQVSSTAIMSNNKVPSQVDDLHRKMSQLHQQLQPMDHALFPEPISQTVSHLTTAVNATRSLRMNRYCKYTMTHRPSTNRPSWTVPNARLDFRTRSSSSDILSQGHTTQ
jgi:hypothetical protein